MITLHSHLQPQYKYELFHIYVTENVKVVCSKRMWGLPVQSRPWYPEASFKLCCRSFPIWQAKCSNIQFIYFIFNSIFHVQLFVQYSIFIQYSMLQFHSIRNSIFNYLFNVQLLFNIQLFIQCSTFIQHSIIYSMFNFYSTFNYLFNVQLFFNIQLSIQCSTFF